MELCCTSHSRAERWNWAGMAGGEAGWECEWESA